MRWSGGGDDSSNVEDRRGESTDGGDGGGGTGRRVGLGGGLVLLVLSLVFGRNFFADAGVTSGPAVTAPSGEPGPGSTAPVGSATPVQESADEARNRKFAVFVLDDAQAIWARILPSHGGQYRDAKLVLFRNAVRSGCGVAESAMGPFYCPTDEKVYLDLGFFDELRTRLGAAGDFAHAYVITHELGHHVQKILGTSSRVRQLQESRPGDANELSVRLELQADCFAGVWGQSTSERKILESGDIESGLNAASAVGDDRIQRSVRGTVRPESFTHGSSAQRVMWFKRGFESGNPESCDTFAGAR